jgi:hypothetical protein
MSVFRWLALEDLMKSEGLIRCDVELEICLALFSLLETQLYFLIIHIYEKKDIRKRYYQLLTASEIKKPFNRNAPLITLLKTFMSSNKTMEVHYNTSQPQKKPNVCFL